MSRREASKGPPRAAATKARNQPGLHMPTDLRAALDAAVKHHQAGRLDEAETLYRRILRSHPEHPDAVHLLGVIAHLRGQNAAAEDLIRQAIQSSPGVADYHNNLGNALQAQGKPDEAEESYRRALSLDPRLARAYNNLGNVLRERGKLAEAEESYRRALEIEPSHFGAHSNLGIVLKGLGRYHEAEASYRKALLIKPDFAMALANLGHVLHIQGKLDEGEESIRRAVALSPDLASAHSNLGILLKDLGRYDEAEETLNRALKIDPDYAPAKNNLAHLLLLLGDFGRAWALYAARGSLRNTPWALWQKPLPDDLHGKRLLLLRDQGLGDEIFFLRFAPELKNRGARITYQAEAKIASIVKRLPFIDAVVGEDAARETADMNISVGDLPYLLGMKSVADIPPPVALTPLPERVEAMAAKLAALGPAPYIGVTWRAGVPGGIEKTLQRAPLTGLANLLRRINGTILALQRKPEAGEIDQLSGGLGRPVHDFTALNEDLEEMLALLSLLHEYVTVSNTNVYLRASTGKTSRILVPNPPECRWMAEGTESPWFPGCRVYRQKVGGAWAGAFEALARDLKEALGGLAR